MKHYYKTFWRLTLLILAISAPAFLHGQGRPVTGVVTEQDTGSPIPGANIKVKGTSTGAVTDLDGNYRINASNDDVLVFSFVGYLTQEVPVGNRSTLDVALAQDVQTLEELVVVGYGTQERAKVTGAISSVSAKEISEQPVISIDQALQGRAAGVTVANTGSPGQNPLVRIRGIGTANNNDPLYVIDGMPAGGLNEINPNDIESMQILKDASAAAIYGSRAANGVIMVTTKKGTKGKTSINFDSYYGVQNAWKQLDLLNTDQFLDYGRDMMTDEEQGVPPRFNRMNDPVYEGADQTFAQTNTDWQDAMFRPAPIQDYNLSVSGGGENSVFSIGGGYFKQEGIMLGTGFERYSFRANSEFSLGDRIKIGETLIVSRSHRQNEAGAGGSRSQVEHMIKSIPYIPVYNPNHLGGYAGPSALDGGIDPANPVAVANLVRNNDENMKLLGTAYTTIELIDGLQYKFMVGLDMNFGYNDQFTPMYNTGAYNSSVFTNVNQNRTDYISPLLSNQLTYDKSFGDHSLKVDVVAEKQTSTSRNTQATGRTELTSAIDVLNGLESPAISGERNEVALLSYLGRVNYDYAGKYLFAASVRRDGSSKFGNEKWGTFPSVSLGWRLSEEAFLNNVPAISEMKLRGSWGQVGNNNIPNYRYQATMDNRFFYHLGGGMAPSPAAGYTTSALPNADIRWETTVMTNIGLDFGLFNESLRASVEYFHNETQDMLLQVPVAPSLGYDTPPTANVGTVVNKGWELTTGYYQHQGEFQWSLSGNISFVQNELTSLGGGNPLSGSSFEGYRTTFTTEGEPIAYFDGWVVDRIYQTQAEIDADNALDGDSDSPYQADATSPGDIRFKDLDGDGAVTDDDRTNIGHFLPDFSYGLSASADYKNFDLSLFFQGVQGNEILNTNLYDLEGMTRVFNAGTAVLDRWTPENTDTDIPRAKFGDPNRNSRISTRFVEDGSYLRLKNLTIGYTIPTTGLESIGNGFISRVRFYVTGQNLLTFTNYSGYDPEIGAKTGLGSTLNAGVDYGQYPQARTILGGIQIGF